ncbi:MAG: hypothetical protein ACIAQU_05405, partial [Phycisphaerales bacterium JB064]
NDADVQAVWDSRWFYAPHSLDARDAGGLMNGWQGCKLLAFHMVSSGAVGQDAAGLMRSWVGGPVSEHNVPMLTRPTELAPGFRGLFRSAGRAQIADGLVFRSRLEPGMDGFFAIRLPDYRTDALPAGVANGPVRQLVTGPEGLVRVLVSANSRGTRGSIAPQPRPESLAHGLAEALRPQLAGVLMRPAAIIDVRGGWLGFDTARQSPEMSLVRPLHTRDDAWATFTRIGSGTMPDDSLGPGSPASISDGGMYRMLCEPIDGSLMTADAPLVVQATVLAFPGSSELQWAPAVATSQGADGDLVDVARIEQLDTTRLSVFWGDGDALAEPTRVVLAGDVQAEAGEAIVIIDGPSRGGIGHITSVERTSEQTTLHLSHPLGGEPRRGNELRIGPYRFVQVEYRFDAVASGDQRVWRGLELRSVGSSIGVMVYGHSAWRPDVDGFIVGSAGKGASGYTVQLDTAFPGATGEWARVSDVDIWIAALAQQGSDESAMSDYVAAVRAGLKPGAEVMWASSAVHGHVDHHSWHTYIAQNADAEGLAAVSGVNHPRVGDFFEQLASGMRYDDSHFTPFGNTVIAQAWLDQLQTLVLGDCALADYDQDGEVTVFDLLVFQTDWEASVPRADLDGDGQFLIFDYLILLTAMDDCG